MKKVRILSIDGGGIRGIIPAVILEYIENELKEKSDNSQTVLQDYFDMIAGTSTGGILTCFYLHPSRFPAEKAVELYADNGKKIFKPQVPLLNTVLSFVTAKYSVKSLETALNDAFGKSTLSQVNRHSLVTAYDIVHRKSVLFTMPEGKKIHSKEIFI